MSRILRPAVRLAASARPPGSSAPSTPPSCLSQSISKPSALGLQSRTYAAASGVKEYTVRDALQRGPPAEELESNDKVFILGEEVAQYNGAYKVTKGAPSTASASGASSTRPITESGFADLPSAPPSERPATPSYAALLAIMLSLFLPLSGVQAG